MVRELLHTRETGVGVSRLYAGGSNSSPCNGGTVGDGLAVAASIHAPAYTTNAGSEHSLTANRLTIRRIDSSQ